MAAVTRRIADGDLEVFVRDVRRRDEIGVLARSLNIFRDNAVVSRDLVQERERVNVELERAKTVAEASSRAKTDFLANMSHELRTPLNAVIGFSEFIQNETLGPVGHPKYRDYLTDIHNAGTHLLAIIEDVLDMARIERGRIELHEQEADLSAIIREAATMVNPAARQSQVTILVENVPDVLQMFGDSRKLTQIVINLLSNAVKFSNPGGRVTVAVQDGGVEGVTIAVTDQRIGMSAEQIKRIGTPFFQAEGALRRNHHGTGLGLAITKKLVEMHGGKLTFESTPCVGTVVHVSLPRQPTLVRTAEAA